VKIANFSQVEENEVSDPEAEKVFIRVLIGPDDGAENFHMRRFRVLPGGHTPHHVHGWEHEVFILAGRGELQTPDGPRGFEAGDVVFVDPGVKHQFTNSGESDLEFLCLIPAVD